MRICNSGRRLLTFRSQAARDGISTVRAQSPDVSFMLLLAGAATLAGCGSDNRNQAAASPENAGQSRPALAAQPIREEHRSLQLTPQWLAGRWQTDDGDCSAGDTFFTFNPDGSYTFLAEEGRWSLEGDSLTIEITAAGPDGGKVGDKNTVRVTPAGPNEAEFRSDDGQPPIRVFRCHEG